MNEPITPREEPATLPALEQLLVRAARRRVAPRRRGRRRWFLVAVAAALVLAAGAAAATGLLPITSGHTAHGTYTVQRRPVPAVGPGEPSPGRVCLQLIYDGGEPSYGCGEAPTASRPFGLLVADPLAEGSRERVVYGLVADDVVRVAVLGGDGKRTDGPTEPKHGLPGRFFAVVVPHRGRIEVVGYDAGGRPVARIGSNSRPDHPPRSKAEAIEQGDPAGFAPTLPPSSRLTFEGHEISEAEVGRLGLICLEGRTVAPCYRTPRELEAARGHRGGTGR